MPQQMSFRKQLAQIVFVALVVLCLTSLVSASIALLLGILFSLTLENPFLDLTRNITQRLLQLSVIGLGAGMNLQVIGRVGLHGVIYTVVGISTTIVIGLILGKLLKTKSNVSLLLTVGTAICGGSAIAAIAPLIRARPHEIPVALAIVFILNAAALFIFPPLGHYFELTQTQFGLWSALAIHDTSSVIGAAIQYGAKAVDIATTVKLARALWIIPVALIISFIWNRNSDSRANLRFPYFILGFILVSALVTFIPSLQVPGMLVNEMAKKILVLTLFLIGSTFVRSTFSSVGMKPFIQGIVLWFIVTSATLGAILLGYIQ